MPPHEPEARLSFVFEDDGSRHADLVLTVDGRTWRCDSYYLALDTELAPRREDSLKVRWVLERLLEQWHAAVATSSGVVFLPFEFSDQGTGWLRCRGTELLEVQLGWAPVAGWSFYPSQIAAHLGEPRGFHATEPSFAFTQKEFLRGVEASIARART